MKQRLAKVLDGRESRDVFPTHYRANDPDGIRRHAEVAGFELAELELVSTNAIFSLVLPLAFVELLWIRAIRDPSRAALRSNIIAVLRRT